MLPRACSGALYEAMELAPDCSTEQVKRQYRKLALQYHPDRTGGTTTQRFQEIERANHILSSSVTRRIYDQFGSNGLKLVNEDTDDLEAQFSSAVRRIQAIFTVVFVLFAALFVSACVACHLADDSWGRGTASGPHGPSATAWIVTFIPVYILCLPTFLLAAGLAISGLTQCSLMYLFWSFESFIYIAIVGTTVAALAGRTSAATAIMTWMVWYGIRTVRKLFLMLPMVFAEDIAAAEVAALHTQHMEAGLPEPTQDEIAAAVTRMSIAQVVCLGGYWGGVVLPTLVEWSCVWAFWGMCLRRATSAKSSSSGSGKNYINGQLSFWSIMAPLIVLVCLRVVLKAVVIVFFSDTASTAARARASGGATTANTVVVEGTTTTDASTGAQSAAVFVQGEASAPPAPKPSFCDTLSSIIVFSVPEMALLWMACGWAATADRLFNVHQPPARFYQTAWMASLPLLATLLFPTLLVLALLVVVCISGRTLLGVDGDPYATHVDDDGAVVPDDGATESPGAGSGRNNNNKGGAAVNTSAPLSGKGSSRVANYQSTNARPEGDNDLSNVD